jgi:hypothetical protein
MQVLAHAVYMTCKQAIKALQGFSACTEQVRAALAILAALEDPQHLHSVIDSLAPEAQEQARSFYLFTRPSEPGTDLTVPLSSCTQCNLEECQIMRSFQV